MPLRLAKAIIDGLVERLGLREEQVAASRAVLRDYGNTAGAAVLFVLAEAQRRLRDSVPAGGHEEGVAMSYGPGLTVELARLTYVAPTGARTEASAEVALAGVYLP